MAVLKSNSFWGSRSGFFDTSVPKGHNQPVGRAFRQRQYGAGRENKNQRTTCKLINVNKRWFK